MLVKNISMVRIMLSFSTNYLVLTLFFLVTNAIARQYNAKKWEKALDALKSIKIDCVLLIEMQIFNILKRFKRAFLEVSSHVGEKPLNGKNHIIFFIRSICDFYYIPTSEKL